MTGGNAYFTGTAIMNLSTSEAQTSATSTFSVTTNGVFSVAELSTVQIILKNGNTGSTVDLYYSPTTSNFDGGSIIVENNNNVDDIFLDSDVIIHKIESKVGSGKKLHFNTDCDFNLTNLTITSGNVQIDVGAQINLTGTGALGAANALIIESNINGTGSFIATGSVTGTATVQRYLTNYGAQGDSKYHFISSPVSAQVIKPNFVANTPAANVDFYSYDEETNYWINTKVLDGEEIVWNVAFEDYFTVGKGYLVAYPTAVTKEFTGTLNSYESGSPLIINCTNTNSNGWNLIGNPFPSAIDWDLVVAGGLSNMDNALYYYDHNAANYLYYIKYPEGTVGSGSRYIPAMQGFMVHATTAGSSTVSLHEGYQTHSDQAYYKNGNTLNNLLSLTVRNGNNIDETYIYFNENATNEFDGSYDAYKLYSYAVEMPQVYSINNNTQLAINSLKSVVENQYIAIGFKTQVEGVFEIEASGIESFTGTTELLMEDTYLNTIHDFNEIGNYAFGSEMGIFDDRFILHFSPVGIDESELEGNNIQIYASENTIYVLNNDNVTGDIEIVNMIGQKLASFSLDGTSKQAINFTAQTGLYIVNVKTDDGYISSQKIIISK